MNWNDIFEYVDGDLVWKPRGVRRWDTRNAGNVAGRIDKTGYRSIKYNGKLYLGHRIVFEMFNGYVPRILDHIDGNPLNNRIENLRPAEAAQNSQNKRKGSKRTSSVHKGVCRRGDKWFSQIRVNRKTITVGHFDTEDEAGHAYNKKAIELCGEFASLNPVGSK